MPGGWDPRKLATRFGHGRTCLVVTSRFRWLSPTILKWMWLQFSSISYSGSRLGLAPYSPYSLPSGLRCRDARASTTLDERLTSGATVAFPEDSFRRSPIRHTALSRLTRFGAPWD